MFYPSLSSFRKEFDLGAVYFPLAIYYSSEMGVCTVSPLKVGKRAVGAGTISDCVPLAISSDSGMGWCTFHSVLPGWE